MTAMLALATCALVASAPARAQITPLPGSNEVNARARPGFDAKGIPVGGLRFYPTVNIDVGYNDNIYNSDLLDISDRRVALNAQGSLRSNWSRNSLSLDASTVVERYDKTHSENHEEYRLNADGRYDVSPTANVSASAYFARATEPRGSAGDILIGGERIVYYSTGGTLGSFVQAGRLSLRAGGAIEHITYNDARVGTVRISQSYRDHVAQSLTGEVGLLVSPTITLYGNTSYNRQRYDDRTAGFSLNAHGFTALGGVGFEINRLISARASIGYQRQSFAYARFATISGFTYDAAVLWNPTPLLTLDLTAHKSIQQSPYLDISGIVTDAVALTADYEFLRNVLVNASVGYQRDNFQGVARVDRRFLQSVNVRYLINRYLQASLNYDHRRQVSNRSFSRRYEGNTISAALRIQI